MNENPAVAESITLGSLEIVSRWLSFSHSVHYLQYSAACELAE